MDKISRTQKKKQAEAQQKLGEHLVGLSEEQTAGLDLPHELLEAVAMARGLTKHEARRRQLQYIGRLMRDIEPDAVKEALQKLKDQEALETRKFKLIEQWRDDLVKSSDEHHIKLLTSKFPDIDEQQLVQLVKNARNALNTKKARQTNRKLFRFLSKSIQL